MKRERLYKIIFFIDRQHGFSLTEIMVVIAIIGTLSAIAIPNILSFRDNSRLRAAASEMLATFRKAQIDAVKKNFNTVLVFNVAAGTTTVYLDNGAGAATANDSNRTGTEPILITYTLPPGSRITGDLFGGQTGYTPRGLPLNTGSIQVNPTSASSQIAYRISLSFAGHTQLEASTDGGSTWH